jgi:hypothetical protein
MSSSAIVQKLWNYCNVLRDDGMSYGDYVEQLTYLLFLKMADERAAWSVSFQLYGFSSVRKWAIMRSCEVSHG